MRDTLTLKANGRSPQSGTLSKSGVHRLTVVWRSVRRVSAFTSRVSLTAIRLKMIDDSGRCAVMCGKSWSVMSVTRCIHLNSLNSHFNHNTAVME
jgi:hypothetical protein